jgi:hypothetical protein
VIGTDHCPSCERVTPHALVARRARPAELVGTSFEGSTEVASIGWTCTRCGGTSPGSIERVVVQLATLGLDPQPVTSNG